MDFLTNAKNALSLTDSVIKLKEKSTNLLQKNIDKNI